MKIGSENHKNLFCQSFINSYVEFEPERLPWPVLDSTALDRLRGIPFWREALITEREAGMMVGAFAETIADPVLREAIALQATEESRHARLIQCLIEHYDIQISPPPEPVLPSKIETAFIDFGFGECLDSFLAFGIFGIARQAEYFPAGLFEIFDPILNEEARHIMFFVNWVTYWQINHSNKFNWQRGVQALWHYGRALQYKLKAFSGSNDDRQEGFTATGASTFMDNLPPELFISTCLQENARRMSQFDRQLLQPELLPQLAKIALNGLKLLPRRQPSTMVESSQVISNK